MATATSFPDRLITVVGQAKTIALKFKTGKPTKTGNMMYSLTSGLVAFFPPAVAAEIDSLHLSPGEPFTICHRGGPRWDVERAAQNGAAGVQLPTAPRNTAVGTPPNPTPPPSAPQLPVSGQGRTTADMYVECFREAVRIAPELMAIAKTQGFQIAPTFEDLRTMATHFSIGRER